MCFNIRQVKYLIILSPNVYFGYVDHAEKERVLFPDFQQNQFIIAVFVKTGLRLGDMLGYLVVMPPISPPKTMNGKYLLSVVWEKCINQKRFWQLCSATLLIKPFFKNLSGTETLSSFWFVSSPSPILLIVGFFVYILNFN